ncbi:hypothetical protein FPQ18DRAFT_392795 [Pyronema domesticum]|uniref:Uncharacterized protein n=1 Tax=Pyronema omphalodes (strain CBS 100304) TaxID=1076935 RepID=U4LHH6_PYROM|nr:hypothetical protein FPQ18DRAFT_392795 [Pyronema domesticum]CCX30987.1 Protein of unknown function [Pyronema omphalodes CBS 100304]
MQPTEYIPFATTRDADMAPPPMDEKTFIGVKTTTRYTRHFYDLEDQRYQPECKELARIKKAHCLYARHTYPFIIMLFLCGMTEGFGGIIPFFLYNIAPILICVLLMGHVFLVLKMRQQAAASEEGEEEEGVNLQPIEYGTI